jgi:hypothetical protein
MPQVIRPALHLNAAAHVLTEVGEPKLLAQDLLEAGAIAS